MDESGFDQVLLVDESNEIVGYITQSKLLGALISGEIKKSDCVDKVMIKQYKKVPLTTTLGKLSRLLRI